MNKINRISISLCVAALLISGCSDNAEEKKGTPVKEQVTTNVEPQNIYGTTTQAEHIVEHMEDNIQNNAPHIVVVLETIDSGGYTYMKVDEAGDIYWAAGPQTELTVGSTVSYIEQMVMQDFTSKSLNRTFDLIVFASTIIPAKDSLRTATEDATTPTATPNVTSAHNQTTIDTPQIINIVKNRDGYRVEDIYTKKAKLKDKVVKIDAQVVKVSKNIMGKDWIHLQDGSGSAATSDIIATSVNSTVEVGDIITTSGVVKTDVDLGYGYNFSVLIEEAQFTSIK
ncbi:MAG: hypothetical protein RBR59_05660 [Sulfurimonadaceae bacterium]|jgi:PBP1b-binding outer membrane lipoprotein LpoB|nr:hypothetical protein [Sulfurimonadaceae bacterium]